MQLARLRQSKGLTQQELAKQLSKNNEKIYFSKSETADKGSRSAVFFCRNQKITQKG